MWFGITFLSLWNQNSESVDSVIPFCGMPYYLARPLRGEGLAHVVHDHVEGGYSVCRDEEKLVRVVRQSVNVPDLAFRQQFQLGQVGLEDLHVSLFGPVKATQTYGLRSGAAGRSDRSDSGRLRLSLLQLIRTQIVGQSLSLSLRQLLLLLRGSQSSSLLFRGRLVSELFLGFLLYQT